MSLKDIGTLEIEDNKVEIEEVTKIEKISLPEDKQMRTQEALLSKFLPKTQFLKHNES